MFLDSERVREPAMTCLLKCHPTSLFLQIFFSVLQIEPLEHVSTVEI